jgi:intracellular septation protein A
MKSIFLNTAIEFGPLLTFALLAEYIPFLSAVAVFIFLTATALIVGFVERGGFAWFPFLVAVEIVGFGLWSILAANPFYFIIKDTIFNGLCAIVILTGCFYGKGYLKYLFQDLFAMAERGWQILSCRWGVMFLFLALSNELARHMFDTVGWTRYKVVATVITAVFAVSQFWLAKKYRLEEASPWGMRIIPRSKIAL